MRKGLLALLLILTLLPASVHALCDNVVRAEVRDGVVYLYHEGAEWNCCAEIHFTMIQEENILHLLESEYFGDWGPCYCICCFDLMVVIVGLEPGIYTINVWDENMEILLGTVIVEIEGTGKAGAIDSVYQSECGGWPTGLDPLNDIDEWGAIKSLFR